MKKRITAVLLAAVVVLAAALGAVPKTAEAEESTNLRLGENSTPRSVQMVAGSKVHMKLELLLKEGYSSSPVFEVTAEDASTLSFSNVTAKDSTNPSNPYLFLNNSIPVILEFDVTVDEYAKIGTYRYYVTYTDVTADANVPAPGRLELQIVVVGEKIPPQIAVISNTEFSAVAGEEVKMTFTVRNEGEIKAMNTYLAVSYDDNVMIPTYTPLNQKIGDILSQGTKQITVSYRIAEDARTQRVKLPIAVTYKNPKGESYTTSEYCLYLDITGKEENLPQLEISSALEFTGKAGEELALKFTVRNVGKTEAVGTSVVLGYDDDLMLPLYTTSEQEIGTIPAGASRELSFSYRILDNAKTQRIKFPIKVTCSSPKGTPGESAEYTMYLDIEGGSMEPSTLLLNTVKQSPDAPKAGEKMTVSFYLENSGDHDITQVKLSATGLSSNGFEPVDSEPYQYIGTIAAGTKKKVELTVKVGENVTAGLNTLGVGYSYVDGYGVERTENTSLYILNVKGSQEVVVSKPKLMVSDFHTDPEEVSAGSVFDFTFELLNTNETIDAKNIKVTVTSSGTFSVTVGGNSFFVNQIKAGETAPITINLKASAAATTSAYPINIRIEYEYDGMITTATYSGETVEEQILLQVKETLRPSVESLSVGNWDTPVVNQSTTMNFEFYNMGKSTLNNVYLTVEGDFMLANNSTSYFIGNISAGMPEYVECDVVPLVEGSAAGTLIIHMEDSNGDEVTFEKGFTAYVQGEMSWNDPNQGGWIDDPYVPVDGNDLVEPAKPIVPLWVFLCIQAGILIVVIPVTRKIRLAAYKRKIRKEDGQ